MNLNPVFSSNMVLQAMKPVKFFGEGAGKIIIKYDGEAYEFDTEDSCWSFETKPHNYGGPYNIEVTINEECTLIENVMFGDVFLFSGQSNMAFKLGEERPVPEMRRSENLRYYFIDIPDPNECMKTADGWRISTDSVIELWSCIGYHVAEMYEKATGRAVGIICAAQGASNIQSWIKDEYHTEDVYVSDELRHGDYSNEWFMPWNPNSMLYHFCTEKIAPYTVSNIIWYQGESNTADAEVKVYTELLNRLIKTFRDAFEDEALPFTVIEIADFDSRDDAAWHGLQEAQRKIVDVCENVTVIKSADVSPHDNIHPATKEALSKRIADALIG